MEYINYVLNIIIILLILVVTTKIYMWIANYVGEKLKIGKLLKYLLRKIRTSTSI
jgi:hypothetical protein